MEILKQFKKGDRNYQIMECLINAGGEVVDSRILIQASMINPTRGKVVDSFPGILNDPRILKKERELLSANINRINNKLEGFNIISNRKEKGYCLVVL